MLELLQIAPYSTFFILALATGTSLATTLLNRKFMNKEEMTVWQREISEWNAEKKLAKTTGDRKLLAKVKKKEPRIMQIQGKMSKQQMKTFAVTFVPLILLWQFLIGFFQKPVASLPGLSAGVPFVIPFFFWYLICSLFVGQILSRALGVKRSVGMSPF